MHLGSLCIAVIETSAASIAAMYRVLTGSTPWQVRWQGRAVALPEIVPLGRCLVLSTGNGHGPASVCVDVYAVAERWQNVG